MNISKITKEQILESATKIVQANGLDQLNIRAVAKECQVSVGSIYNYFPDKSELIVTLIEHFWKQTCNLEDMKKLKLGNFSDSYLQMYDILYAYFHRFEHEWMLQLQSLDQKTKQLGRKMEESFYRDIRMMLDVMIQHDASLSDTLWTKEFTKEDFIAFVFANTLQSIKQNVEQPSFLLIVIQKLLS